MVTIYENAKARALAPRASEARRRQRAAGRLRQRGHQPEHAWGLETTALKPETMATLIQMARDIYPHDQVPDRYYAVAVKGHDESAGEGSRAQGSDRKRHRRPRPASGRRRLHAASAGRRSASRCCSRSRTTPFFQTVRGGLVVGLYNQKEVWPIFGYEGESVSKGGYIDSRLQRHRVALSPDVASTDGIWEETMAATYDLNDDSVVVIIGSGAGGGTLGNELAQKGIDAVILEAGGRARIRGFRQRRVGQLRPARLARQAHDVGDLARREGFPQPAGLDRQGGRRLDDALGRRLAALPGARVQDEDRTTARSRAPTCSTGRSRSPSWSPTTPRPRTRWA